MKGKWVKWMVIVIGVIMAVKTGANVYRLWRTGERVKEAEKQVEEAKKQNEELTSRLAEVQTPEFLEREARERFGYGKEGEEILVIVDQADSKAPAPTFSENTPNWKKWRKLYLGI